MRCNLGASRHVRGGGLLCRDQPLNCGFMTYVEAASAPLRKTGQIKLHGKEMKDRDLTSGVDHLNIV